MDAPAGSRRAAEGLTEVTETVDARAEIRRAVEQFGDPRWRLSNLYFITDKKGRRIKFEMNWAQESLFNGMHYQNVILKARQFGFTTFIQLFMLDACLFNSNVRAGTVAHTLTDAQAIFRDKVKYPYDSLPEGIRTRVPIDRSNAAELVLGNNSAIRVGTSHRSGTLNYLHVSEYGKLCAQYPEKAREVRTGALNTVQAGQLVFIESTAEGQEGHFHDLCQEAQTLARTGAALSPLDFKFFFMPWWRSPDYAIDPRGIVIPDEYERYFEKLRETAGIVLSLEQKAWYAKKAATQREDMKREYPSTPEEAFEASVEGAYYARPIARAELEGRIGRFPPLPGVPVHSAWDIGVGDSTAIWFYQEAGTRIRFIGCYDNTGEGAPFYANEIRRRESEGGWRHETGWFPHDAKVKEWGAGRTRMEQLVQAGLNPRLVTMHTIDDGINAVRDILSHCEFDEAGCAAGLKALKAYRKDWDEERAIWLSRPRHDWTSHYADAFRTFAMSFRERLAEPEPEDSIKELLRVPTLDELMEDLDRDDD